MRTHANFARNFTKQFTMSTNDSKELVKSFIEAINDEDFETSKDL